MSVAFLALLSAGALGWAFSQGFPREGFVFLFVPVIGAAAYFRGRAAGIVVGLLSFLVALYVIPPANAFAIEPDSIPVLLAFLIVAGLIVEGGARLRLVETDSSRFISLVQLSDDAILTKTLDGTILTWNQSAERLYGYTAAEVVGRHVSMLAPPDRLAELADIMARLRRGEHVKHIETARVKKDGTRIDVSLSISPMTDAAGWVVGASAIARDISDRKRVEKQQRFLVETNQVLVSSLEVQTTLDALTTLAVPALADWCTIEFLPQGSERHAAVMHHDPEKRARAREAQQKYILRADAPPPLVARTGQSTLCPDVTEDVAAALVPDPELRSIVCGPGLRSALAVPLMARGRTLGALSLFSVESGRRYNTRDLAFAEQLAHQAALALDNARLHQAEQEARHVAERAASRISRLHAAAEALARALTPEEVALVTLDHLVEDLGVAAAAVLVRAEEGGALNLLSAVGYSPDILARWRSGPEEIQPVAQAMRTGRVVWYASWADFRARYPEAVAPSERARLGARVAVPLMLSPRALGALYLNFETRLEFGSEDLEFMLTLGRQCAQAIDRARYYAREHEIASTLQRALLPSEAPRVPGVDVQATYVAAAPALDVGGDWYDVFPLPDGRVVLSVGDVTGHGIEAAATMGEVRHAIRAAVLDGHDPGGALAVASKVLQLRGDKGMATAVVGILDPIEQELTYAGAGHPAPIIATADGIETLETGGPPLGLLERWAAAPIRVSLPEGALLILYTDGLIEYDRDYIRGEAALLSAIQQEQAAASSNPAQAILDRILPNRQAPDDIAIVAVRWTVGVEPVDVTLPAHPGSLARTRRILQRVARDLGLDEDTTFAIQVAAGEATTNVIEHAYDTTPGTVRLRARTEGQTIRIEVEDRGRWRPQDPAAEGMHGLGLMRALADAVDVDTNDHGTTVRLAFSMSGARVG